MTHVRPATLANCLGVVWISNAIHDHDNAIVSLLCKSFISVLLYL